MSKADVDVKSKGGRIVITLKVITSQFFLGCHLAPTHAPFRQSRSLEKAGRRARPTTFANPEVVPPAAETHQTQRLEASKRHGNLKLALYQNITVTATGSLQTARQPEACTVSEHDSHSNWGPQNGTAT